jgi:glycosyltransferase involved in cell wall biosynthesis
MISVVVPYPASNSSVRTRALHWIDRLADAGVVDRDDVAVHGPGFSSGRDRPDGPVLLQRNVRRITRGGIEERWLRAGVPGVYDLDDGLPWDDGNLPGLGRWWKRPFPRSLVARRAASAADRVIAGNEIIAEWAHDWCDDVRIVPTCIEPHDYDVRTDWSLPDHPTIGWIGSPATEPYLRSVAPALAAMADRHGATLEIISGAGETAAELTSFSSRIRWRPGIERRIANWDLGIMPLADGVYERAKCGYKLLQYAASGVPAVVSPVGVNASMIERMDGFAAGSLAEWTEALDAALSETADRRARRAEHGLRVAGEYAYDAWQSAWADAVGW